MDWKQIITDISACGLTQMQIAEACGCTQGTIGDLVAGRSREPRHSLGQALRLLRSKSQQRRRRRDAKATASTAED